MFAHKSACSGGDAVISLFSAYMHHNVIESGECLPFLAVYPFAALDIQKHHSSPDQSRLKQCVRIPVKERLYI
jgi:hypothetical protein